MVVEVQDRPVGVGFGPVDGSEEGSGPVGDSTLVANDLVLMAIDPNPTMVQGVGTGQGRNASLPDRFGRVRTGRSSGHDHRRAHGHGPEPPSDHGRRGPDRSRSNASIGTGQPVGRGGRAVLPGTLFLEFSRNSPDRDGSLPRPVGMRFYRFFVIFYIFRYILSFLSIISRYLPHVVV